MSDQNTTPWASRPVTRGDLRTVFVFWIVFQIADPFMRAAWRALIHG